MSKDLTTLIAEWRAEDFARNYAYHLAIGFYADADDPDEAQAAAVVSEAKLYSLTLSNAYARETDTEFTATLINSVITNAFRVWRNDFDRLMAVATTRLAEDDSQAVREQMQREISDRRSDDAF